MIANAMKFHGYNIFDKHSEMTLPFDKTFDAFIIGWNFLNRKCDIITNLSH